MKLWDTFPVVFRGGRFFTENRIKHSALSSEEMCVFPLAFRTGISDFPPFPASLRAVHHQLFDRPCFQFSCYLYLNLYLLEGIAF